ncbi:hypothetical protein [Paenibacillus sp. OK060]|nr:hypothetical protein [Paenibacillus sp. OK060]
MAKTAGVKFCRPRQEIDDRFIQVYKQWKEEHVTTTDAMKQIDMK